MCISCSWLDNEPGRIRYSAYLGSAVSIVRLRPTIWRASSTYCTQISRLSPGSRQTWPAYQGWDSWRVIGARSVRDAGQTLGQLQVTLRLPCTDSVSGRVKYALFLPYTTQLFPWFIDILDRGLCFCVLNFGLLFIIDLD